MAHLLMLSATPILLSSSSDTVSIMAAGRLLIYLSLWLFLTASLLYVISHLDIYPHSNQTLNMINLHPANMTVIDLEHFQFLLNDDHCAATSPISLLILVHSAPDNWMARQAIRSSWGRYSSSHTKDTNLTFRPQIPGEIVVLVFLLGRPDTPSQQRAIEKESAKEGDMIQGDFKDTYHHLAYKNVMGKLWASHFCPQAEFVVKADDDM